MPSRLLSLVVLALAASPLFAAGEFYCCPDAASGRSICGDTLPEQCRGRAYRVIGNSGNVIKEVGPPLSAEQKSEGGQRFQLVSEYEPKGDQPTAIAELVNRANAAERDQVLLGVTGSGKTYTMAQVIARTNRPALILAPNKTRWTAPSSPCSLQEAPR